MTFDEGVHLTAGYDYLKTGRYTISRDHPPLGRLLNALPLLATRAEFPTAHPAWIKQNMFDLFDVIYANRALPAIF